MTKPRCHKPDQVVDEVRWTSEQRPHFPAEHRDTHLYCMARASRLHQQQVCAAVVRPGKVRTVLVDLAGARSLFNRTFHSLMTAFARRQHGGWIDHVWANGRPDEQVVVGEDPDLPAPFEEVIKACVDLWLDPVRAGDCDHPDDFDGMMIRAEHWGEEIEVKRPAVASERTTLPAVMRFTPMPPTGADGMTLQQQKDFAEEELAKALPRAQAEGARARSRQPARPRPRPEFRGVEAGVQLAERAYAAWLELYHERRLAFRQDQTVVFPAGTVRFRFLGARCAKPMTKRLPLANNAVKTRRNWARTWYVQATRSVRDAVAEIFGRYGPEVARLVPLRDR